MELLQQGPAETTAYMIAGYAVIFGVMLIYLVSLFVRWQKRSRDLVELEQMDKPENQALTSE